MTKGKFTLDKKCTDAFRVGVSGYQVYNSPERDVETVHIHGRNGDIISDNRCFTNRKIIYHCWLAHTFKTDFDDFRDFLMSHSDRYYHLEDTYHPDHVYEARLAAALEPQTKVMLKCGEFDVVFDAKPQRFRKDGLVWKNSGTIVNPTRHNCFPLLEVTSAGTITINEQTIKVNAGASFPILIDCETMDCMTASNENQNAYVEMPLDNITLHPGDNTVAGVARLQPRRFDI